MIGSSLAMKTASKPLQTFLCVAASYSGAHILLAGLLSHLQPITKRQSGRRRMWTLIEMNGIFGSLSHSSSSRTCAGGESICLAVLYRAAYFAQFPVSLLHGRVDSHPCGWRHRDRATLVSYCSHPEGELSETRPCLRSCNSCLKLCTCLKGLTMPLSDLCIRSPLMLHNHKMATFYSL